MTKLSVPPTTDSQHSSTYMQATAIHRYGPPKELQLIEVPQPTCGNDQLKVRVKAAGVNPIDWRIRKGSMRFLLPARFPLILGFDVAGEVVESQVRESEGASAWKPGDKVYCMLNSMHGGGYAEYAVVGAAAAARMPEGISFEEAAAVPLAALTALQSLRDLGKLKPGDEVLINGAAGGVGTFAVQIASALGARVTAVCSKSNIDLVKSLGASEVIDYQVEDVTKSDRRFDIMFDAVAKSSCWRCRQNLKRGGTYVTTLPSASNLMLRAIGWLVGLRCRIILVRPRGKDLDLLSELIGAGKVRPVVAETYPLSEAATAHEQSESGHVHGKLVLTAAQTYRGF